MGKPRDGHQIAKPGGKNKKHNELDFEGDDDGWVMVKKQRVRVLIPPPTRAKKSTMPNPRSDRVESMPIKQVNDQPTVPIKQVNDNPTAPIKSRSYKPSVDEPEKVAPPVHKRDTDFKSNTNSSAPKVLEWQRPPRLNVTIESENNNRNNRFMHHKLLGVSNMSRMIKRPRLLLQTPASLLDAHRVLDQRLRASLLEKKLQRAGGLSRWLASLGLGQFVNIFQGKSVGKFQLVNLTMEKLKDMGADAVGPRRKLMHAIDCICQPYCFEVR